MAKDFSDILDKDLSEAERPKPLAIGSYIWVIGAPKLDSTGGEKDTPFVEYPLTAIAPGPDVDEEELAASLQGKPLSEKKLRATFYLTPDALWRFKQFAEEYVGIESGKPTREVIQELEGRQVFGMVEHTPNKKKPNDPPYANISQFAKVPE